ncbi:host cell division inhibitor Icd-like protein [Pectobacterium punjabense]|uniref:host cell division inhibitor Icd-like protein n=1 Tax=Pectobacterium punjabense TaxID=2108399 RepID=UPI0037F21F30
MADIQSTQTRPKFQYRFLALNRHDKKAKPCRLSVEAGTEREARRILSPHFILSFAARIPLAGMVEIAMPICVVETETQEVRHV